MKFTKDDIALVYGSIWKQRYFTKIGDDYFPEPAQWDITNHVWRPYFVANGTDWWATLYPADNMKRPTGPTCDGCHSVELQHPDQAVTEWNVGCERCHGPGSEHVAHPTRANILNPARMDYVARERHLHPVPFAGTAGRESDRGQILRLARGLPRRAKPAGLLEARRPHARRTDASRISPTAPRTRTGCRETISCRA